MKRILIFIWMPFLIQAQISDTTTLRQIDSMIKVSRALTSKSDFVKALEVNSIAEEKALEKFGRLSAAFAGPCFNHGRIFYFMKNLAEAEKWYLEAKDIREKTLSPKHLDYAWSLNNLGIIYMETGYYEKAEPLLLQAKAIREEVLGKEHPDYISSLNNLGNLNISMGYYERAEPLFIESKIKREKILGKSHPDYASSLNNLGLMYYKMGEYEKAEVLLLESKLIREKVLGKEHPDYGSSLNNLAALYQYMFNYEKAEPLYLEAKSLREKIYGKENLIYATSLSNLGSLYFNMGLMQKADTLYSEAREIQAKTIGKGHPEYAKTLLNLSVLNIDLGNYEKAEQQSIESKSIQEKVLGKDHPDYAIGVNSLADLYMKNGDYLKAEPLLLEAKSIRERVLGKNHPNYTYGLSRLSLLYEKLKKYALSEPLLEELSALQEIRISKATSFLSERELSKYTSAFQESGDNLARYLLSRNSSGASEGKLPLMCYDHSLFYKGFLLTSAARLRTLSATSAESEKISVNLRGIQRRLGSEYSKPITDRARVDKLEKEAEDVEKELARTLGGYADAHRQIKWSDVQKELKTDEAAIEFMHVKINSKDSVGKTIYIALVLKSGSGLPQCVELFEEQSIDSLLHYNSARKADYVNGLYTIADRGIIVMENNNRSLYEILWKPLEKQLEGIKTIYYSPSGLLYRINFEAIPLSEVLTLADKYQLINLNSTRQLVVPYQIQNQNNNVLLIGGVQFDQDSVSQNSSEPIVAARSRGGLSFYSIDSTLRGGKWNYLAGTEREIAAIENSMQKAGLTILVKKGYEATEESFKNIGTNNSASPRILHIATHGYFFPDPKESRQSSVISRQEESVLKMSDHPMLRSGLIMAGGNAAWQGKPTPEGREDGILTAYEISQMNLSNTELVVLSACETGLGDIKGNEGVYGLQRAFKIAGAKYLIMSLWQVPDKQTSLLMTTFYKKWLEEKMTIPNAFRAAQKELRDQGLDPYQWAGFVLVE